MGSPLARTFGDAAERYESGRPEWPEAAVDAVGVAAESTVLDLGAGTGKLSRVLVRRFARVIAVEPLDAMRDVLARAAPEVEALGGSAEEIPLPDRSVDAVFTADAFHWFDPRSAIPEIERVLRPGGTLAVLVSGPAGPTEPAIHGVHGLLERHRRPREHPAARIESGDWLADFDGSRLGERREAVVPFEQQVSRAQMLDYFASVSWIAGLPAGERDSLLGDAEALLPDVTYRRPWNALVFAWRLSANI